MPDSASINTIILGMLGLAGTLGGAWLARKQQQIHVLVNSNMEALKRELARVSVDLEVVTTERDEAEETVGQVADAAQATGAALATVAAQRKDRQDTGDE